MKPITAGIHGLLAAGLAVMAMSVTAPKTGGWIGTAVHKARPALSRPVAPVVLTKGGFVIYDSQSRAETIAQLWNITPANINSYKRW